MHQGISNFIGENVCCIKRQKNSIEEGTSKSKVKICTSLKIKNNSSISNQQGERFKQYFINTPFCIRCGLDISHTDHYLIYTVKDTVK